MQLSCGPQANNSYENPHHNACLLDAPREALLILIFCGHFFDCAMSKSLAVQVQGLLQCPELRSDNPDLLGFLRVLYHPFFYISEILAFGVFLFRSHPSLIWLLFDLRPIHHSLSLSADHNPVLPEARQSSLSLLFKHGRKSGLGNFDF